MEKAQSLADYLGTSSVVDASTLEPRLEDIDGPREFAQAVLNSLEFRQYVVNGLRLGVLPSPILIRVMDLAGWQKPPDRVEHTGRDGQPIELISEVRRVVVHAADREDGVEDEQKPLVTH